MNLNYLREEMRKQSIGRIQNPDWSNIKNFVKEQQKSGNYYKLEKVGKPYNVYARSDMPLESEIVPAKNLSIVGIFLEEKDGKNVFQTDSFFDDLTKKDTSIKYVNLGNLRDLHAKIIHVLDAKEIMGQEEIKRKEREEIKRKELEEIKRKEREELEEIKRKEREELEEIKRKEREERERKEIMKREDIKRKERKELEKIKLEEMKREYGEEPDEIKRKEIKRKYLKEREEMNREYYEEFEEMNRIEWAKVEPSIIAESKKNIDIKENTATDDAELLRSLENLDENEKGFMEEVDGGKSRKKSKKIPWKGWEKVAPSKKQQKTMFQKCGKKCFLGKQSYPICTKNTCKINRKGVYAAYIRARQYKSKRGNKTIANKAKKLLAIKKVRADSI